MKIILKEDVRGLGYKDDVVEVKDGYGRNYLIPQGKAVVATPSAIKVLEENQRQRAHKLAKIKEDAMAAAAALEGVALTIGARSMLFRSLKLSRNSATMLTANSSSSRTTSRKSANTAPPSSSTRKWLLKCPSRLSLNKQIPNSLLYPSNNGCVVMTRPLL